jgi:hypothetical protein
MPKTPDGNPDGHGDDDRLEYHQTQYQPADRPGSVDESMENVLHQRRSDFRNAERDRDEYSDGAATTFVDPATTRVSDLGSATKEYNKLYAEDAA